MPTGGGVRMTTLVVDGRPVSVGPGLTLLEACRESGAAIPSLCHLEGVSPVASCRVCLVEVRGLERPVPACASPALEGMEVRTDSPALRSHRRSVAEMLFASGDHVCAHCPASGRCELQDLARAVGLDHLGDGPAPGAVRGGAGDASRPLGEEPGGAPPRGPGVDASRPASSSTPRAASSAPAASASARRRRAPTRWAWRAGGPRRASSSTAEGGGATAARAPTAAGASRPARPGHCSRRSRGRRRSR
jgi:hypothetical protein